MPRKGELGMMWQRVLFPDIGDIDPEHEKELRLVAQARAGAAWALSALVARYQPPVVRYLVRLTGSAERGRVLAEDVLVRMAKRVRGPHGGDHLRLWLLRTSTEVGLDALRHPQRADPRRIAEPSGPVALIAERVGETPVGRWVAGWGTRMRQQGEPRAPVRTQQFVWQATAETPAMEGEEHDQIAPREALKYRMVRAVLAELPYGDAQCLSLHLVAGLNQTEVAQALGIAPAVARRRIVQGLQLFGRRYDAALAGLGLSPDLEPVEVGTISPADALPTGDSVTGTVAAPAIGALDAPGVVDADAPHRRAHPSATMPLHASTPELTLPIVRLAQPTPAPAGTDPAAAETDGAGDAEERALTSAAIMAYLRSAAANVRLPEQLPPLLDAHPIDTSPERTEADRSAQMAAGSSSDSSLETETVGAEASATDEDRADMSSIDSTPVRSASDESASVRADETTVMPAVESAEIQVREPRLIPVLDLAGKPDEELVASEVNTSEPSPAMDLSVEAMSGPARDLARLLMPASATLVLPASDDVDDGDDVNDVDDTDSELTAANDADNEHTDSDHLAAAADAHDELDSADDAEHYVLVVEAEPEPPAEDARLRLLRARRTQVLSADGEAEDPSDAAIWPVS